MIDVSDDGERDYAEEAANAALLEEARREAAELDDDELGCEGHESLAGEHMAETVYCDGSCRQGVQHVVVVHQGKSKRKGSPYLTCRDDPAIIDAVAELAAARGATVTDVIRAAVRRELAAAKRELQAARRAAAAAEGRL